MIRLSTVAIAGILAVSQASGRAPKAQDLTAYQKQLALTFSAINMSTSLDQSFSIMQAYVSKDEVDSVKKFLTNEGFKLNQPLPKTSLDKNEIRLGKSLIGKITLTGLASANGTTLKYDEHKSFSENFISAYRVYQPKASYGSLFINSANAADALDIAKQSAKDAAAIMGVGLVGSLGMGASCGPGALGCFAIGMTTSAVIAVGTGIAEAIAYNKTDCSSTGMDLDINGLTFHFAALASGTNPSGTVLKDGKQIKTFDMRNSDFLKLVNNHYYQNCTLKKPKEIAFEIRKIFTVLPSDPSEHVELKAESPTSSAK